jgi:hypothetical protein
MLALLLRLTFSTWWNFSASEFGEYESRSLESPIYVICTAPYCPHCVGLPDSFRQFSATVSNTTSVVFTHIDCTESELCGRAHVRGVPSFILIRGRAAKYWTVDYSRSPADWAGFLRAALGPTAREVNSDGLEEIAAASKDGGTSFHLSLAPSDRDILRTYRQLSQTLRIYGCALSYEFKEGARPTITALFSPRCGLIADAADMQDFTTRYRFSDFHHYDMNEYRIQSRDTPFGLAVVPDKLGTAHKEAFAQFSERACGRMRFGWASIRNDHNLFSVTNVEPQEAPFLYITGTVADEKCVVISKKKAADRSHFEIFENVIGGKVCTNRTRKEIKKDAEQVVRKRRSGLFILFLGSVGVGVFSLARPFLFEALDPKLE